MIEAVYHRKHHRLTLKGHAHSGEPGHDLVCASASILAYTLASAVMGMSETKHIRDPKVILNEGSAEIGCCPLTGYKATVQLVFDSICAGYQLLAHDFPENISFKIVGAGIETLQSDLIT